jgi:shikimate kinase/3-dehydroquinate synthase
MGAGKSRTARLARKGGAEVVDVDAELEAELGSPIADFFERAGEEEFRRREAERTVAVLAAAKPGTIVALGGGAVLQPAVAEALRPHTAVWLDVDADRAWERVAGKDGRPLARDRETFARLHAERRPVYRELADARMLWAESASGAYPVFVGSRILGRPLWPLPGRRFVVTDSNAGLRYAEALAPSAAVIEVDPGEQAKSLAVAERVMRQLTRAGMSRHDHLAALGGGVVGDLGGFCAAVFQRGVAVAQYPTTLVAQVDSAYGGKTGVDLPEAKNYVGAYHLPAAVVADTATLTTLPPEELAAGFAEVIKTALLAGDPLWSEVRDLAGIDPAGLDEVIFACVRHKADVVARDERDSGHRQSLNLGHTVGHAIEVAGAYRRYRHGEAVGLGLLAALRLSGADELRDEVEELLARRGLPTALDPGIDVESVLAAVEHDKKRGPDGVGFVVLEEPGAARTGVVIEPDRVRLAVQELAGR